MRGVNLENTDTFGKSDPYLVISVISQGGAPLEAYRTEHIDNDLNPNWAPFTIPVSILTQGGNVNTPILLECFDDEAIGTNELIGSCKTTFAKLFTTKRFILINEKKKQKKKNYTDSGAIEVVKYEVVHSTGSTAGSKGMEFKSTKEKPEHIKQLLQKINQTDLVKYIMIVQSINSTHTLYWIIFRACLTSFAVSQPKAEKSKMWRLLENPIQC